VSRRRTVEDDAQRVADGVAGGLADGAGDGGSDLGRQSHQGDPQPPHVGRQQPAGAAEGRGG
jgi:hypothetical protein